jgi:hypothetical protein
MKIESETFKELDTRKGRVSFKSIMRARRKYMTREGKQKIKKKFMERNRNLLAAALFFSNLFNWE